MQRFFLSLLLIILLTFASCGGEAPKPPKVPMPPPAKKAAVPAPPKTPSPPSVEAKVELPELASYSYDPKGKPDPFRPLVVEKLEAAAPKVKTPVVEAVSESATPLERMDLGEVKLVAIVWNIPDPKGMIEDKNGRGYILAMGTGVGKNKGKVIEISPKGVVIRERYETSDGKFKTREVTLKLYPDQ